MTRRPDSSSEKEILEDIAHLADVVVDDSAGEEVEVMDAVEVEVTEVMGTGGASYLATTAAR